MSVREFDVVVLGAGPAGEVAAGRLGERGLEVAIVEQELIGGECSFYACMPSKALLRPAELLGETERVPGVGTGDGGLDVSAVLERRDEVIHDLDDSGQLPWLEERGIALFRGHGRLDGERRVVVGDDVLEARRAVIVATGSGAAIPPIDGLEEVSAWSNREVTTAKRAPASMIVLGGGPVGCEMAQAWSSLGTRVVLVESSERLLPSMEPFAGEQLAEGLREAGVELRLGGKAVAARREDDAVLELEGGETVAGEQILVAIGREPRTAEIGLETVGLETGESIEVDSRLRAAGSEWLYAVGDVNGRALLTHAGKYQARIAADVICGDDVEAWADQTHPPQVVYTDPQIAAVGHTLQSAREAGIEARVAETKTSATAGASFVGRNTEGTTRLVIDDERGVIVGATFVGFETAEFLQAATIAITGGVPLARLRHAIPVFPSRSEIWLQLVE